MGLFSRKKKTYVSSSSYPLGEDDDGTRVDYLKYTVLNATMQGRPIGESITQGYLRGQGMSLRNAFKYARDHYTHGVPTSAALFLDQPDTTVITPIVQPKFPGAEILYVTTMVASADFEWWAEEYLTKQFGYDRTLKEFIRPPAGVDANAAVAYDLESDGLIRILLMNTDGSTKVVDFRPAGYVEMAPFLHTAYQARTVFTELDETTTRPATPGELDTVSLIVTIIDRVGERQERIERTETDILDDVATVHKRITMTVTTRPQYLIYRLGAGTYPTIDAWASDDNLTAPYYPSVPLRVNNQDMVAAAKQNTDLYKTSKKLLNRVGADLDKLGEQINSNESVGDIDHAFVMFGVALNTKSQEGKRYLYRYFEHLRGTSAGGTTTQATKADFGVWQTAFQAGTTTAAPKINAVEIYSAKERENNHDIKIQWDYIDTQIKSGQVFPNARPGDVALSMSGVKVQFFLGLDMVIDGSQLYARRQIDVDTYEEMEISGLVHENFIYQGKSVITTAFEAFNDADEEGFIIPLSQQIVRQTPLVELTDLSYQCTHMVLNSYKVVKQKWYQTSLFKIIIVIIAIIIIVVTWGGGTPAAVSLLAMAFVAAGVGLLMAIILAATVYVLAMMVLMNVLMKVAIDLFGPKWGPVIAAMIAFVSMNWESITTAFASVGTTGITASLIMQASMATLRIYNAYAQGQMSDIQRKLAGLETEFDKQMKEIEDLTKLNLGTNADLIDIYGMTQASNLHFEASQTFLDRTLIVGSDVAEITTGLIENFVDVGLLLPNTG